MIIKLFAQILVTTTLVNFFPSNAGQLQSIRELPRGEVRPFLIASTVSNASKTLPLAQNKDLAPKKIDENSLGIVTESQSAIVVDRKSKTVLFEKNIYEPRSIGSITKLMTAHVFLSMNPDLEKEAKLLSEDIRFGGRQHLPLNKKIKIADILSASLIASDNTATAALARLSNMRDADFVAKMNEEAALIGMQQTTFTDLTGLSFKNQSIVPDIVLLLDKVAENELIREITKKPSEIISTEDGQYQIESTDALLTSFINKDPYKIEVAKTGFLPEAGYCLGSIFSNDNGGEVIVVVLGAPSNSDRFQDVKGLAYWSFETFQWEQL